jgi:hypothetical protein
MKKLIFASVFLFAIFGEIASAQEVTSGEKLATR